MVQRQKVTVDFNSRLGLFMTGGMTSTNSLNKAESTADGSEFTDEGYMINHIGQHCQLTVDQSTIMIFGGSGPSTPSNGHFVYNVERDSWSQGKEMPIKHGSQPGCGLVKNGTRRHAVVVGGDGALRGVSILDLETMTWRTGQCQFMYTLLPKCLV